VLCVGQALRALDVANNELQIINPDALS